MEVGELISFFRKQSGMTIDELAAKSGVPKGTLNKIIGGVTKAPTLDNMKSIARALGKTLADFDDDPIETKKSPSATEVAPGGRNAPLYSSEAEELALDYDGLDEFGKKAVRAVADVEKARCANLVSLGTRPMIQAAARSGGVAEIEAITPDEVADGEDIP